MQLLYEDDPVFDLTISEKEYEAMPDKMSGVRGMELNSPHHVVATCFLNDAWN